MPDTDKKSGNAKTQNLWRLIGDTPMIELRYCYRDGLVKKILVKCEQYNLTHSIQDRSVLYILQKAIEQGSLQPSDLIVEAASGNTGVSIAAIGRALGHPVRLIMPDSTSLEQRGLIKSFNADLQLVSSEEGGLMKCLEVAEELGKNRNVFLSRPFEERYGIEVHEKTTGREIGHYLLLERLQPNAFVAGVNTGATITGVAKYLRTIYPQIKIHPLEPAEAVVDLRQLDRSINVHRDDAILMAQALNSKLKLGVGISSGANLLGAIKLQNESKGEQMIITVFPDGDKVKADVEPVSPDYITPRVELLDYKVVANDREDRS